MPAQHRSKQEKEIKKLWTSLIYFMKIYAIRNNTHTKTSKYTIEIYKNIFTDKKQKNYAKKLSQNVKFKLRAFCFTKAN